MRARFWHFGVTGGLGGLIGFACLEVVGAAIGGAMRLAQVQLVEATGRPTTTLLRSLPARVGATPPHRPPSPRTAPAKGRR